MQWHAVGITPDSVSGIPYEAPLECDSCRRSIPRAQVDSMKLEYRTGGAKTGAITSLALIGIVTAGLLVEYVVSIIARAAGGC